MNPERSAQSDGVKKEDPPIMLSGKEFKTRDELIGYFRTILHQQNVGYKFNAEEFKYAAELLKEHPRYKEKLLKKPPKELSVGYAMKYKDTKCFNLVNCEGEKDDWSYLKLANLMFPHAAAGAKNAHKTKFLPGLIVQVIGVPKAEGDEVKMANEEIKSYFEEKLRFRVEMVDYDGDPNRCFVRFDNPKTASNVMIKLTEMSPPPKLAGVHIKAEVLKGKDESDYWDRLKEKLEAKKARKAAQRGRGRGRGGRGRGGFRGGGRGGGGGFRGGGGGFRGGYGGGYGGGGGGYGGGGDRFGDGDRYAGQKRSGYEGRDSFGSGDRDDKRGRY
jgi:hypothetical protein